MNNDKKALVLNCRFNSCSYCLSPSVSHSTVVDCGSTLPTVVHGTVSTPAATIYKSTATISCYEGYRNTGPSIVTCQNDQLWSTPGSCESKFHFGLITPVSYIRSLN